MTRRAPPPRLACAALALACAALALACNAPAAGEPTVARPPDPAPSAPACADAPDGALALLSGGTCPWVLVVDGAGALALRSLGPDARTLTAAPPEGCEPCRFDGVVTAAGPLLVATRPSPASEVAEAAWLGATAEGASLVGFAPLWYGQPDLGDRTVQGPTYALAPRLCGRTLVLWPTARLPGASGEEPPDALVRAAGAYALRDGELAREGGPVPGDISACAAPPLELP